jgi:hypothetical protein
LCSDSQKLDSCNEGGLNLISKNNNNNSNNNRNRTTSSNYVINNELPSDDIDPTALVAIKSERVMRSPCDTEMDKLVNEEQEKSGADDSQESASENEGDNNNNEDDEREEGEICDEQRSSKINALEKSKMYKKKKRRRRKRETTLKSDQSQQIEDDDDEMATIKDNSLNNDEENDGNLSDSYINTKRNHSVSITRRRHSSSSDPVNLSLGNKSHNAQDDSDDANIDVETISNAPTKVSSFKIRFLFSNFQ